MIKHSYDYHFRDSGRTALMKASNLGHIAVVVALLNHGASLNVKDEVIT
jgi:ankyrin repeat protein